MATKAKQMNNETEIRNLIDGIVKAMREKNADALLSNYSEETVMFVMAPPLQYTPDNAPGKKGLEEWFASWNSPLDYEVRDLHITTGNDVAFSHSLNRMSGTRTEGEKMDMWFRHTLCFRKIDGKWKITHEHESVPFYMDGSYRAAVDLKP